MATLMFLFASLDHRPTLFSLVAKEIATTQATDPTEEITTVSASIAWLVVITTTIKLKSYVERAKSI